MGNLTRELRVVEEVEGAHARPNSHVVVFERQSGGLHFRQVIPPGGRFEKNLLDHIFLKSDQLVGYSVSCDRNLVHKFSRPMESGDQRLDFTLHGRLYFEVVDPRRVAEAYRSAACSDPVQRLVEEIEEVSRRGAHRIDWKDYEDRTIEASFNGGEVSFSAQPFVSVDEGYELANLAADLGFRLHRISLRRTLPETERVVEITRKKEGMDRDVLDLETTTARMRLDAKADLEEAQALRTNGIRAIERIREFQDKFIEAANTALGQATDDIRGFEDIRRAVAQLTNMRGDLDRLLNPGSNLPQTPLHPASLPAYGGGGQGTLLLSDSSSTAGPWCQLLSALGRLADSPKTARRLRGPLLRSSLGLLSIVASPDPTHPEELDHARSELARAKTAALEGGGLGDEAHFMVISRLERPGELLEELSMSTRQTEV